MFYPGDAQSLRSEVAQLLLAARMKSEGPSTRGPKALIVPHAGYVYSGPVAASGYALIEPGRGSVERVVLLGPSHRVAFRGLAASPSNAFRTPLGDVPVDREAVERVCALPFVEARADAHAHEHSLEVHLPFLQQTLGAFRLVPIVVGGADKDEVRQVLDLLWGGPETLIVVSSDLSHYLEYDAARACDASTARKIEAMDSARLGPDEACGQVAVSGLLDAARARGLVVRRIDLRNSGDTAGSRAEVVGYGTWAFESLK